MVCSMKSMCVSSFVLIGCCVGELQRGYCPFVIYIITSMKNEVGRM